MAKTIQLKIDGKTLTADVNDTILETALKHDIDIPNLCYNRQVSHTASCRLCIVKIKGKPGGIPACTTPVEDGMVVTAFDDELEAIRRTTLDLLLSSHNDDCISCVQDGECELQDLAFRYNLGRQERQFPPIWQELNKTSDTSAKVINFDASKCIQCGRCVRACYEIQGKGIINFVNRGIRTTIGTGFELWDQSRCDGCGQCIQICPVGAITEKQFYGDRKRIRVKDIEHTVRTTCPYCGVGCQLDISTRKGRIIKVAGADATPNHRRTCVKGRFGLDFVDRADRLRRPMIRKNGVLTETTWEEALTYTAERFSAIKNQYGADVLAGLSSARCTNEENFVFQKFMRAVIGTNNVDHCARLCHASTVAGLAAAFGSGAMTNAIAEFEHCDVFLVTGSNTTETHPVIATYIKNAVLLNNAKLIVVDPRRIDLVQYATVWLRQRNGTDVAWINGLMNVILAENLHDPFFITGRTEHFEELQPILATYTPEHTEAITRIPAEKLRQAAEIYGKAARASIVYSMGITQHTRGTDNVKALANLALLTGNVGRESTGVNPLRGQNNVQGACDMGALPNVYPGYQKVTDPDVHRKFEHAWDCHLAKTVGLTVTEIMHAAHSGDIKALYIMGENPMVSDPNINHVRDALNNLDFLVCQDIFPTETTELADVVLPAMSFAEKEGTFTNTERRVLPIRKIINPIGEAREDWQIIQEIARRMGYPMDYESVKDIVHEINFLTPQYAGITYHRLANGEMLQWPCRGDDDPGTGFLHQDQFATPNGLGQFSIVEHKPPAEQTDDQFPFVLTTGRILYHYHTGSMSRRAKALNSFVEDAYFEICREDMEALGLSDGEIASISSRRGTIEIAALATDRVKSGTIFIPFHFAEAAANKLTLDTLDPVAKIPELKVCAVKIEKL